MRGAELLAPRSKPAALVRDHGHLLRGSAWLNFQQVRCEHWWLRNERDIPLVVPEINAATSITLSTLPTDAAVSGAAAVAVTQFLEHPSVFFDVS